MPIAKYASASFGLRFSNGRMAIECDRGALCAVDCDGAGVVRAPAEASAFAASRELGCKKTTPITVAIARAPVSTMPTRTALRDDDVFRRTLAGGDTAGIADGAA